MVICIYLLANSVAEGGELERLRVKLFPGFNLRLGRLQLDVRVLDESLDVLDGLLEDISGEGLSVPVVLVLDIGEVLSFEGLGDDAGWLVGLLSSLLEGTDNGLDVVTIDDVGLPSERVESRGIK